MAAMPRNPARTNSRAIFTLLMAKRWDHMRLGFAVQLGTVRFLGTFLDDLAGVPSGVIADLAQQLGIGKPDCVVVYREGRARWQHAREIRVGRGYRPKFLDAVKIRISSLEMRNLFVGLAF